MKCMLLNCCKKIIRILFGIKHTVFYNIDLIVSFLLGIIFFISIFGLQILNPYNLDLYIQATNFANDPLQHMTGWLAFLHSDWFFPLGLTDQLTYPNKYSVMYTDSIPLFAVFFKLFSFLFNGDYQFLGLYGCFNFGLQGLSAAYIARYFIRNKITVILFACLLILMPVILLRVLFHNSLSSHWVILITISYILYNHKNNNIIKDLIFSFIISVLAIGIHSYFFPIVFGLLSLYYVYKFILNRKLLYLSNIISLTIFGFIAIWLFGGFYNIERVDSVDWGFFRSNLNILYNSMLDNYSYILKPQLLPTVDTYENFAFLGLGNIILCIIALFIFIYNFRLSIMNFHIKNHIDKYLKSYIIFIGIIIFIIASSGGELYFNKTLIFSSEYLKLILSTFRASARFIWPVMYLLPIIAFYIIIKYKNNIVNIQILLIIIIIVQFIDFNKLYADKYARYHNSEYTNNEITFDKNVCNELKKIGIKYIFNSYDLLGNQAISYKLIKCGFAITSTYYARQPRDLILKNNNRLYNILLDNNDKDFVMVTTANTIKSKNLYTYEFDDIYITTSKKIDSLKDVTNETITPLIKDDVLIKKQKLLNKNGTININPQKKWIVGNFMLPRNDNRYYVIIEGDNVDKLKHFTFSFSHQKEYKYNIIEKNNRRIELEIKVYDSIFDHRLTFMNSSKNKVIIKNAYLKVVK